MKSSGVRFLLTCLFVMHFSDTVIADLYPEITRFIEQRTTEFNSIPNERKKTLEKISGYVKQCLADGRSARLIFVCTHNSRRSHLAQVWSKIAASHYDIRTVETFSGGTKATALNPRTIAAMQRCGVKVQVSEPSDTNPHYTIMFEDDGEPLLGYSKEYDAASNPSKEFCAVMTCSEADRACPTVLGSDLRVAIPFEDPKTADDTPLETKTYDERCAQIAREMLYVMSRIQH